MNWKSLISDTLSEFSNIAVSILIVFDMLTLFSILLLVSHIFSMLIRRFFIHSTWQSGFAEAAFSTALALALMHGKPGFLIKQLVVSWQAPIPFISIVTCVAVVWGLGVLLFIFRFCRQNHSFALCIKEAGESPVDHAYLAAASKAGVSGILCKTLPGLNTPGVFGVRRPVILLPENFIKTYTEEERLLIYLHELNHIHSRDHITYTILRFFRAVFFLHIPIKKLLDTLELTLEQRCDQQVLKLAAAPVQYSELLLHAVKNTAAVPLSFSSSSYHMVARRIESLFYPQKGGKRQFLPRMVLCLLTVCCLLYPLTPTIYTFGPYMSFAAEMPDHQIQSIPVSSREEAVTIFRSNPDVYSRPSFVRTKWEGMFAIYTKGEALEL